MAFYLSSQAVIPDRILSFPDPTRLKPGRPISVAGGKFCHHCTAEPNPTPSEVAGDGNLQSDYAFLTRTAIIDSSRLTNQNAITFLAILFRKKTLFLIQGALWMAVSVQPDFCAHGIRIFNAVYCIIFSAFTYYIVFFFYVTTVDSFLTTTCHKRPPPVKATTL